MKGSEKFREKLPDIKGKKIIQIPLLAIVSLLLSLSMMVFFDYLTIFIEIDTGSFEPILPILGVLSIEILGFYFLSVFWRKREQFLMENATTAYQKGLKYAIIGVALIVSVSIHSVLVLPLNALFPNQISEDISITLSKSFFVFFGLSPELDTIFRVFLGILFLIVGVVGYRRIIVSFGVDYMLMLYSYYPEESNIKNEGIFNIIQHPTYLSVLIICFSGFLFNFSLYTLFYFSSLTVFLFLFIRNYEEKELKNRFGSSYVEYQNKTPRFIPKRTSLVNYFKYLGGRY